MDNAWSTSEPRSCWQRKPPHSRVVSGSSYQNSAAAIPLSITNTESWFFPNIRSMQLFAASPVAGSERWFFLDVFEGGPAHVAGIKPGDMLLAVDGTEYLSAVDAAVRCGADIHDCGLLTPVVKTLGRSKWKCRSERGQKRARQLLSPWVCRTQ